MEKSDFAIYQKGGDILSMGFKFENLLKDKGLPAMIGGGKGKFHKNQYGIPVGLALLNRQLDKKKTYHRNFEGGVVKEELYRKLLFMGEQRKTSNSKTRRKHKKKKKKKRKTRKLK
tara:strand:+ start:2224 stop:2571 length:348 start_codon:yes stop_codon:yes gene_type:complete